MREELDKERVKVESNAEKITEDTDKKGVEIRLGGNLITTSDIARAFRTVRQDLEKLDTNTSINSIPITFSTFGGDKLIVELKAQGSLVDILKNTEIKLIGGGEIDLLESHKFDTLKEKLEFSLDTQEKIKNDQQNNIVIAKSALKYFSNVEEKEPQSQLSSKAQEQEQRQTENVSKVSSEDSQKEQPQKVEPQKPQPEEQKQTLWGRAKSFISNNPKTSALVGIVGAVGFLAATVATGGLFVVAAAAAGGAAYGTYQGAKYIEETRNKKNTEISGPSSFRHAGSMKDEPHPFPQVQYHPTPQPKPEPQDLQQESKHHWVKGHSAGITGKTEENPVKKLLGSHRQAGSISQTESRVEELKQKKEVDIPERAGTNGYAQLEGEKKNNSSSIGKGL